jgi:hypothetical protein
MGPGQLDAALARIRAWGEARDWAGADPYDGLNSPLAPVLSLGTPLGRRVLTQAVKRSPLDLRPVLGIRPAHNAKAIALVASGYLRLARATGDAAAAAHAERRLSWLVERPSPTSTGKAWGYHFDVQTRFFFYPRNSPNAIATSFVAQALLEGAVELQQERWLAAAREAARFLVDGLLVAGREPYFRYIPSSGSLVHNANLLACAVLSRTAELSGEDDGLEQVAAAALQTTLRDQRDDGSWPYAVGEHGWVDNFHTGYVLESLASCTRLDPEAAQRLDAGLDYWSRELFRADGRPRYFPGREGPLDAHNYAQAIDTWVAVADRRPEAIGRASRMADLLIADLLAPAGYVYVEPPRGLSNRVAFVRWSTAPSFRALAGLAACQARARDAAVAPA